MVGALPGVDGGGSLVMGDNSTGNVNKKLFVKRSCTEAMLKVSVWAASMTAAHSALGCLTRVYIIRGNA